MKKSSTSQKLVISALAGSAIVAAVASKKCQCSRRAHDVGQGAPTNGGDA